MVIVDLETTGFNPSTCKIIEVAALDTITKKTFQSLINPGISIPIAVTELTGITNAEVKNFPYFYEVKQDLLKFIHNKTIIGYNVAFDKRFLVKEDNRFSCYSYKDYLKYIRKLDYDFVNCKLHTVAKFFNLKISNRHRAMGDVNLVYQLIQITGFDYE